MTPIHNMQCAVRDGTASPITRAAVGLYEALGDARTASDADIERLCWECRAMLDVIDIVRRDRRHQREATTT